MLVYKRDKCHVNCQVAIYILVANVISIMCLLRTYSKICNTHNNTLQKLMKKYGSTSVKEVELYTKSLTRKKINEYTKFETRVENLSKVLFRENDCILNHT